MKTCSLWDTLPLEIVQEITEYNKLPYLDELHGHTFSGLFDMSIKYMWIDIQRTHQDERNIYGDFCATMIGGTHSPYRENVIRMMKINKLRIRRGMKTKTMINHLIKL